MISGIKVNELMCGGTQKPMATQHCEITTDCKWKIGRWKPVRKLKKSLKFDLFSNNKIIYNRFIAKNFLDIIHTFEQCSCNGYTKRRVQCYDMRLNRQSNNCPNANKPEQKKRCDQPATCTST